MEEDDKEKEEAIKISHKVLEQRLADLEYLKNCQNQSTEFKTLDWKF